MQKSGALTTPTIVTIFYSIIQNGIVLVIRRSILDAKSGALTTPTRCIQAIE